MPNDDRDEQLKQVLSLYHLPPKSEIEADRDFVWNLLKAGCPPKYILSASENILLHNHPPDAYSDLARRIAPHWVRHIVMKEDLAARGKKKEYIEYSQYCTCSECGEEACAGGTYFDLETPFCPQCGIELYGETEIRHEYED